MSAPVCGARPVPDDGGPIRRVLIPIVGVCALLLAGTALASHPQKHPQHCSAVKRAWSPARWRRGQPKERTSEALRSCSNWAVAKRRYYRHRKKLLWREEFKPFVYPDGSRWAVPWPIAACESGENYFVGPSGAYGLIPPYPQYLPPRRQDEIAADLYRKMGDSPWAPYEGACAYR